MDDRQQWLAERQKGIGGSDAAAIMGMSPYKSNVELWREKTGLITPPDISDKPAVSYGIKAETPIRELFKLKFPQYRVEYNQYALLRNNPELPFAFATLDGELADADGEKGILEIKTARPRNAVDWDNWNGRIPQQYYLQILHQFIATGYKFAYLSAELVKRDDNSEIRNYFIERKDCEWDIETLKQAEIKFWRYVESETEPNLLLPKI